MQAADASAVPVLRAAPAYAPVRVRTVPAHVQILTDCMPPATYRYDGLNVTQMRAEGSVLPPERIGSIWLMRRQAWCSNCSAGWSVHVPTVSVCCCASSVLARALQNESTVQAVRVQYAYKQYTT